MTTVKTPTPNKPLITDYRYRFSQRISFFYGWIIVWSGFLVSFVGGPPELYLQHIPDPYDRRVGLDQGHDGGRHHGAHLRRGRGAADLRRTRRQARPTRPHRQLGILGFGRINGLEPSYEIWHLYAIYIVLGISGQGAHGLLTSATLTTWFVMKRGRAAAFATMGNALSGALLVPLSVFVMGLFGWRAAWVANGLLFLPVIPLTFLLVRRPEDMGLRPDGAKSDAEMAPAPRGGHGHGAHGPRRGSHEPAVSFTLREVIKMRSFWLLVLANVIGHAPIGSVILYEASFV